MKLIIQADDYGISEGVIYGIVKGVKDGSITCVGMFSNMPCSPLAAELIKDYDICLGQDINICTGPCVSDPEKIPTIAKKDGILYTKKEHCRLDDEMETGNHMSYEECLIEVEAQIEKFKELVGRYPAYLNGHSYHSESIDEAVKTMSKKYNIPIAKELEEGFHMASPTKIWYRRPFPFEEQINAYAMDSIREDKEFLGSEYGILIFHCGYIDPALLEISTFSLIRVNDLKAVLSQEMKDWIKDNHIELITYNDLTKN